MYKPLAKVLNKGCIDTVYRKHLGLGSDVKAAWRALYKQLLTKNRPGIQSQAHCRTAGEKGRTRGPTQEITRGAESRGGG